MRVEVLAGVQDGGGVGNRHHPVDGQVADESVQRGREQAPHRQDTGQAVLRVQEVKVDDPFAEDL